MVDQGSAPLGVTYLATVPKVATDPRSLAHAQFVVNKFSRDQGSAADSHADKSHDSKQLIPD